MKTRFLALPLAVAAWSWCAEGLAYPAKPDSATFKKSAIWLEDASPSVRKGGEFTLRVHYRLDASDTWGDKPTHLMCMPLGPWIDNPDGVVNKKRRHIGYHGLGAQHKPAEVGEHVAEFRFKLKEIHRYNSCFFLCKFKRPDGKDWPWEFRGGSLEFVKGCETFRLEPTALGGLFTYGETPEIEVMWGPKAASATNARLVVRDVDGNVVLDRDVDCTPSAGMQKVRLDGLSRRGSFSATLDVPGVGSDWCFFGTIPKFVRENGRETPFAVTDIRDEDYARVASALGFSFTRLFTAWKTLETSRGEWHFESLDRQIDLNSRNGLRPWLCLYAPPAWALPEGMWSTGYEPSPFDLGAWKDAVSALALRYKGRLFGFEWLNEILPGNKCKDPVKEYVAICKAGCEAAKSVDEGYVLQLAGGLWPHNFRVDCLNAGVGEWIDVLPVHYSTYDGVVEAKKDLAMRGANGVAVIDNETAKGMTVWGMDAAQTLSKSLEQCRHVMTRWPDELCAGAKMVTYFGGNGDPCGNWSYMLDAKSPRPVAVTLGVVQGKIGYAKPVGKFFMEGLPVQLFELGGKAIAFVASPGKDGVGLKMPANGEVTVTDYLGNETAAGGGTVVAGDMPVIVEGLDLDRMKLHAALRVGASELPVAEPQVVVDSSERTWPVPVTVANPYYERRAFTVFVKSHVGEAAPVVVALAPGETRSFKLEFAAKVGAKLGSSLRLAATVETKGAGSVEKPFALYLVSPATVGNLLVNGDFEAGRDGWGGKNEVVDAPDGTGKALAIVGAGAGKYKSSWQTVEIPVPGQKYLYTCWMRGEAQGGGSNLGEHFSDGTKSKDYYLPQVFSMGSKGSEGWRLMVKHFQTHANTKSLSITPVADGTGRTLFDNISLSLDRGTDFAAFAGRKGGEARPSAVPLCCDNQLKGEGGYRWTPVNLSGVATFEWDDTALFLRCEVVDDVSSPCEAMSADGEEILNGDALALAIFPKTDGEGRTLPDQLRWYMSLASPGGGSGKTTLFRPAKHSMGAKAGQLAKDSSVYQVSFRREGERTIYELVIPWPEIPSFAPAKGASFGCSLVLFDADGGAGRGRMVWGADIGEGASQCGVVTLVP